MKIRMIPCVKAADMPPDVEQFCIDQGISTHYQNEVVIVDADDDDPLAHWFCDLGIKPDANGNFIVAILAT